MNYLQVADIEPLVDRVVDGGSGLGGSGRDGLDNSVVGTNLVGAVLDRDVAPKRTQKSKSRGEKECEQKRRMDRYIQCSQDEIFGSRTP